MQTEGCLPDVLSANCCFEDYSNKTPADAQPSCSNGLLVPGAPEDLVSLISSTSSLLA